MTSGRGQETGRRRRTAEVIGAQIEATTRFKAAELKELSPEVESTADLVVTTRQRIDLEIDTTSHTGRLPSDIPARPDIDALEATLLLRLATAESQVATRIQQWATEEPGRYRRLLPGASVFSDAANEMIGTEWPCAACGQRGRTACPGCTGSGAQTCPDCQGRRHGACRECRGLGRLACPTCDGRGLVRSTSTPAAAETGTAPAPEPAMVPCAACSQGWLNCQACAGRGEQDCARCAASGRIVCPDCHGEQELACPDCAATGWHHRLGRLRERLEVEDLVEVHHADPAIAAAITAREPDVATLDTTCTVEQVRYTTAPLAVQAVQRLKLPVRQANLLVAGQPMQFAALGPALEVVDFQHVAAVLMTHDLVTLEKNATGSGRHLGEALQRFLQSPLNQTIATRMPAADLERLYPGLVDEAYRARAVQSVQTSVERLWQQQAWRPTLACVGGAGVLAALAVALGSPRIGVVTASLLGVAVGVVAWVAADWRTRRRLARALNISQADRLIHPLRRSTTVRRWQVRSLVAAVVVTVASAAAMTQLPHVKRHTEQAQAVAALNRQLDAWLVSEGKDFRLRRYPAADALQQAAEHVPADARVRLVRGWQLLLGPDGASTDARAAERLFDGLTDDPRLGSAAVIGRARATLALRGRSFSALQAAADTLEALPDPHQPEALYTLALIQLAPPMAARAGGLQEGIATLQQAADLGHASACFELGRRLAIGNGAGGSGMKRDVAAARRYLGYAEAKGVPGAAQALANLR